MASPSDDGEAAKFRAELCEVVRVFVDGVLKGLARMDDLEDVDGEAEMVAALMDAAISICLHRGVSTEDLVTAVREHTRALRRAKASAAN